MRDFKTPEPFKEPRNLLIPFDFKGVSRIDFPLIDAKALVPSLKPSSFLNHSGIITLPFRAKCTNSLLMIFFMNLL